jgi:hypothetical protein
MRRRADRPLLRSDVVDVVGRYVRRVDQDVSGQSAVDEGAVRQIVALVVVHDSPQVGVGIANVDSGRIAALNVDRWGSG